METEKIDLNNLMAKESTFKLAQFPNFEFKLTPFTPGKIHSLNNLFGSFDKLLGIPNAENVSKIALFLMDLESASHFKKQSVKTIDVITGEEKNMDLGGWQLLANCLSGPAEQYDIYRAILEAMGYSNEKALGLANRLKDAINQLANDAADEELKKKELNPRPMPVNT